MPFSPDELEDRILRHLVVVGDSHATHATCGANYLHSAHATEGDLFRCEGCEMPLYFMASSYEGRDHDQQSRRARFIARDFCGLTFIGFVIGRARKYRLRKLTAAQGSISRAPFEGSTLSELTCKHLVVIEKTTSRCGSCLRELPWTSLNESTTCPSCHVVIAYCAVLDKTDLRDHGRVADEFGFLMPTLTYLGAVTRLPSRQGFQLTDLAVSVRVS